MQQKLTTYEFQGMFNWIMIYDETQASLEEIKKWLGEVWEPGYEEVNLIDRLNRSDKGFDFLIIPSYKLELLKKWNKNN